METKEQLFPLLPVTLNGIQGMVAVDENAPMDDVVYFLTNGKIIKNHGRGIGSKFYHLGGKSIVGATSNLNLSGVKELIIGEREDELVCSISQLDEYAKWKSNYSILWKEEPDEAAKKNFLSLYDYKAHAAAHKYSEEQMRDAVDQAFLIGERRGVGALAFAIWKNSYIQSLHPVPKFLKVVDGKEEFVWEEKNE